MNKIDKKPFKKIELSIYFLAVMAFSLLVYLFINRNETSLVLKEDTSNIKDKALAYNSDEINTLTSNNNATETTINNTNIPSNDIAESLNSLDTPANSLDSLASIDQTNKIDGGNELMSSNTDVTPLDSLATTQAQNKVTPKQAVSNTNVNPVSTEKIDTSSKKYNNKAKKIAYNKAKKTSYNKSKKKLAYRSKKAKKINSETYNWTVLNRYKSKPSTNLYKSTTYKLKRGESFWKVAKKFRVSAINLLASNPNVSDPDALLVGAVIVIPNR